MNSQSQLESVDKLRGHILTLLDGSLGASAFHSPYKPRRISISPVLSGVYGGVVYAILFCVLPWVVFRHLGTLFWLSVWGSCYIAFASVTAQLTSSSIFQIIEGGILPALSERAAAAIDKDLTRRFDRKRVAVVSFLVALLVAVASAIAIHHDVKQHLNPVEILWWSCGYFALYVMGARTTDVARFYGIFAVHLKIDSDRIYALDPAHSSQVDQIASMGQRVLLFWFGIACSVLTLVPLFRHLSWFVLTVVPVASFFSLGFGTIVFLTSDHGIRRVVNSVATSTLRSVQDESAGLFNRRSSLNELEWKRLEELTSLHAQILKAGSYRNIFLSGLSILVPLVGPAVSNWSKLVPVLASIRSEIFK